MQPNRIRDRFRSWRNDVIDSFSSSDHRAKLGDWCALDTALATLENTMEVFPPLKAALGGLRDVTRHTEMSKKNLREYKHIQSELQAHVSSLRTYVDHAKPTWMAHSIVKIARALEEENQSIKTQQGRGGISRIGDALRDEDIILQSYWRVESLFRQLQTDISLSTWSTVQEHHINSLLDKLLPAPSAWYDAALSAEAYRDGCTPGTRENIIRGFREWTSKFDTFKLYWMSGMPGTGKTTIAYTLCQQLESTKQLGACFFCSRVSPDCRDVNRVFPTIAYQLAEFSNPYRNKISEVLSATYNIAQRNIAVQFNELILKPLISVKNALPPDVVVLVDALDECSGGEQILSLLLKSASQLPIKFIVTSRPEPKLTQQADALWSSSVHQVVYLHDIEKSLVQADITIYLQRALEESGISPGSQDIERLAAYAGNLFIVAATTVRYIIGHGSALSVYRARQRMQATLATIRTGTGDTEKHVTIDVVYKGILEQVLEHGKLGKDEVEEIYQVLWATLCMREPVSIETLSEVLVMDSNIVLDAINRLQSVLHHSKATGMVSTFHASFPDFMFSEERAGRFYCNKATHDGRLAHSCFHLMEKQLRFNICSLQTSHHLDKDIANLKDRVDSCVTSELFYACRYWADHLQAAPASNEMTGLFSRFLYERLLFWIEVVNLKGWVSNASSAMVQVFEWLTGGAATNVDCDAAMANLERASSVA
ncbi:unnamed protein product [Rhizoctonia solani]|uniref:NACHT domain-containing protein n=1 Tax=Rhizoctonia solani TaxID=456999 RepID=A0A8H2WFN7_9AGAM|nr:unnamed protein product [Rhizoctonia solani]